jgi:hypothetical protein
MIPIKIQCQCGQKYAFDVEPVNGRMAHAVACPVCGADGTAAANSMIAQSLPAQPAVAVAAQSAMAIASPARLRISTPTHAETSVATAVAEEEAPSRLAAAPRRGPSRLPGQLDPAQAELEARAKISWGDPPEEVVKFLMLHAFNYAEAKELVDEMWKERAATVRRNGFKKIILGACYICVPIVALFIFLAIGVFLLKLFALTIMVGLWGAWCVLKGIFMVISPKSEAGDVAEH